MHVLEGDLDEEQLGLCIEDRQLIHSQVQFVIHCAASIQLEASMQDTLRSNYFGTRSLLQLAKGCHDLHAFVHVSTVFVNANLPKHSNVDETLYPLILGDQEVGPEQVVEDIMSASKEMAAARVGAVGPSLRTACWVGCVFCHTVPMVGFLCRFRNLTLFSPQHCAQGSSLVMAG